MILNVYLIHKLIQASNMASFCAIEIQDEITCSYRDASPERVHSYARSVRNWMKHMDAHLTELESSLPPLEEPVIQKDDNDDQEAA